MGGIIVAAYASGISVEDLEIEATRMGSIRELAKLVDIRPPRRGLLEGDSVRDYLAQLIPEGMTFDQLEIPTALKSVDLYSGTEVELTEGLVLDAVVATSAFPGIFPPFEHNGQYLVDGGVLNNLDAVARELQLPAGVLPVVALRLAAACKINHTLWLQRMMLGYT